MEPRCNFPSGYDCFPSTVYRVIVNMHSSVLKWFGLNTTYHHYNILFKGLRRYVGTWFHL